MDEKRIREIFAAKLRQHSSPILAAAVESGTDNSFGGLAALGAIAQAVTEERDRCADIARAIDSGRGNEAEIARAIENPIQPST